MTNRYDDMMQRIRASHVRRGDFALLSDKELNEVELQLGFTLPEDYRHFLSKYGLTMSESDVKFGNMDDPSETESSVDVFYGVEAGDGYDLLNIKEGHGDALLPHILPIASSSGGHFCLSLAGDDRGRVYWWAVHSDPDDLEPVGYSFDSFVRSLRVVEE